MTAEPSITCPVCGMTSHNPHDVEMGYCGRCHAFTGRPERGRERDPRDDPAVPGHRWVAFRGGELDGMTRLIRLPLEAGDRYERFVPTAQTWAYDEQLDQFVLDPLDPFDLLAAHLRAVVAEPLTDDEVEAILDEATDPAKWPFCEARAREAAARGAYADVPKIIQ